MCIVKDTKPKVGITKNSEININCYSEWQLLPYSTNLQYLYLTIIFTDSRLSQWFVHRASPISQHFQRPKDIGSRPWSGSSRSCRRRRSKRCGARIRYPVSVRQVHSESKIRWRRPPNLCSLRRNEWSHPVSEPDQKRIKNKLAPSIMTSQDKKVLWFDWGLTLNDVTV